MDELLDHEQARAIANLAASVERFGDAVSRATDIRGRTRQHPWLAVGVAGLAGFLGGPSLLRVVRRILPTVLAGVTAAKLVSLPKLAMTSLRAVRSSR